jgi:hypothetical protein
MVRVALVMLVMAACHPYVSAGTDVVWHVRGPLATALNQTVVARSTSTAAEAPAPAGGSYSLGFGMGARDFTIGLGLHVTDVTNDSFSIPNAATTAAYANSPHYVTGSGSLDLAWTWLRIKMVSTSLHVGPSYGLLVDRATGDRTYAPGVRYGGGLGVQLSIFTAYVDLYRDASAFRDGPASGFNSTSGMTIGIQLRR